MVCKQTLTNTNSSAIFDPDFKRTGGDGGNEVTLPQHVWTDSSCSSNALCPLGESRACQQDGYIKKKLQREKRKVQIQSWSLKPLKKKIKALLYNKLWKNSDVSVRGMMSLSTAGGAVTAWAPQVREETTSAGHPDTWIHRAGRGRNGGKGGGDHMWAAGHDMASVLEKLRLPVQQHLKSTMRGKKAWDTAIPSSFIQYNKHVYVHMCIKQWLKRTHKRAHKTMFG